MPKITFPIVGTFNRVKQKGINPEDTFNMYLINQGDDKVPDTLINVPGFKFISSFPSGLRGRGQYVYQTNMYAVINDALYKLSITLQPIFLGNLETDAGYVQFSANNGNQIILVDGARAYIYNTLTNVFGPVTDPDILQNPQSVTFLDGRFIINSQNTNQFQLSALNDGTTWSESGGSVILIQTLQSQADIIQAVAVNHRILFVIGNQITECWNDIGAPDFPFARIDTMIFQMGTVARGSVVQAEGMLFWLGKSTNGTNSMFISVGGMPMPISTTDVDQEINNYRTPSDCISYYFRENGYEFLAINFTADNVTWLYNKTNGTWTKEKMLNGKRHKLQTMVNFNELNYALAYDDANLYELSQDYLTNGGESIVKERITHRFFDPSLRDIKVSYVEVDCLHGFAPSQGPFYDLDPSATPFIELCLSKNAGITFGKARRAPIGRIGEQSKRTYWENFGVNKDFVFRFRCWANIDVYWRDMALLYSLVGPPGRV